MKTYTEAEVAAAVQAEREACAMVAEETEGEYADVPTVNEYESWHAAKIAKAIRSRGPAPVQQCEECEGDGWIDFQNPITGEITNRKECPRCRPAPAVDVLGIVREYVEAYDIVMDNIVHCRVKNQEHSALVARHKKALAALRALVPGAAANDKGGM